MYVCPCLIETVCAHTFCKWLHCIDMLSCPDLRMTTASSSSWGSSPTSFLTRNTCSVARMRENHRKMSESGTGRCQPPFQTLCCVHWMSKSALLALLPQTRDRSDAKLGKGAVSLTACSVCAFLTCTAQHCRELLTGVMPILVRA